MDRNVNIIRGLDGKKIVLIHDIRFKSKKKEDWKRVQSMGGIDTMYNLRCRYMMIKVVRSIVAISFLPECL